MARERQREREREREKKRERGGQDIARRLSRLRRTLNARAVSPLLEKDATGTPEVPVPVLHREGLFGPPLTEDVDGVHLARTNSRTLVSARIVHSFTVPCSLTALAALADRSFFLLLWPGCCHEVDRVSDALAEARAKVSTHQGLRDWAHTGMEGVGD